MLNVYVKGFRDDCIRNIQGQFNLNKKKEWFNRQDVKDIIKGIDNTIAVKDEYLESPVFGGMSPERLSGGCKAVILLCVWDNLNVYATKCGDNCAPFIEMLAKQKDVYITLHHPMRFSDDVDIYFMDSDIVVHNYRDYIEEFYRLQDEEESEYNG